MHAATSSAQSGRSGRSEFGSAAPAPGARVGLIDILRGLAMVLVCTSHFATVYLVRSDLSAYLTLIGMIATPTFVLVSGTTAGFYFGSWPDRFASFREKLLDRAVLLLTVVHILLVVSEVEWMGTLQRAAHIGFVTDVSALSIIVGTWLLQHTSRRTRVTVGFALALGSWLLAMLWTPGLLALLGVKSLLVGRTLVSSDPVVFPFLPWFGIYLVGTVIGERLAGYRKDSAGAEQYFLRLGAIGLTAAVALRGSYALLARFALAPRIATVPALRLAVSIWQKFPPAPVYLSFFIGAALTLAACIAWAERVDAFVHVREWLSVLGKTSLFVYVLQNFVFFTVLTRLSLPYTASWPLLWVACVGTIVACARVWLDHDMNRFLTMRRVVVLRLMRASAAWLLTTLVP